MCVSAILAGTAALSAGTSLITGNKQAKAASNAADAQVQAAQENTALQRELYYDQADRLEPFRQLGVSAINPLSELLGLNYQQGGQGATAPQSGQYGGSQNAFGIGQPNQGFDARSYLEANPDVAGAWNSGQRHGANTMDEFAQIHYNTHGIGEGRSLGLPQQQQGNALSSIGQPAQTAQQGTTSALDALTQRPGYQFRLGQGNDAYEASAAARGMTMSGAQQKALAEYNQNFASNEYDNEINRLLAVMGGGQVATNSQNSAAGAFGTNAANNNTNAANARASGYINSANASSNAINGVSSAIGGGLGAIGSYQGWF